MDNNKLSTNLAEVGTDCISRQAAIARAVPLNLFGREVMVVSVSELENLPPAQPKTNYSESPNTSDCISRQAAIDEIERWLGYIDDDMVRRMQIGMKRLPSAQSEKEIAKRVLWTGWKGCRYTRYKCPNCKKPVKNDNIYCHRCGQKLMFPHISFTDYVPGEKQETIVRWDDE